MSNIMYAVLYAYTPEGLSPFTNKITLHLLIKHRGCVNTRILVFPTKDRGTGNAITATANRIFGVMAPIIAMYGNLETSAPVYVSGALFIAAGALALVLPFEPMGKASL